jgi:hypothetical protein
MPLEPLEPLELGSGGSGNHRSSRDERAARAILRYVPTATAAWVDSAHVDRGTGAADAAAAVREGSVVWKLRMLPYADAALDCKAFEVRVEVPSRSVASARPSHASSRKRCKKARCDDAAGAADDAEMRDAVETVETVETVEPMPMRRAPREIRRACREAALRLYPGVELSAVRIASCVRLCPP